MTFILFQIHNSATYGSPLDPLLFDAMDPYEPGLFSTDDKDYSIGCLPIIRIVVELASTRPTVVNLSGEAFSQRETRVDRQSRYTAYDIWFSGLDHRVWGPIREEEEDSWEALLDATGSCIDKLFETEDNNAVAEELRRSQAPSLLDDERHWSQFVKKNDELCPDMEIRGS